MSGPKPCLDPEAAGIRVLEIDLRRRSVFCEAVPGGYVGISFWLESIHPADRPVVAQALESQGTHPERPFSVRFRRSTPDRGLVWYLAQGRCRGGQLLRGAVVDLGSCEIDDRPASQFDPVSAPARPTVADIRRIGESRREAEEAQKAALIREVHHRIKNSLQGVIGLIEQWPGASPEFRDLSVRAISQLQSVAVVHGLRGRRGPRGESAVTLQELLASIEEYLGRLTEFDLVYDRGDAPPIEILGTEAVPVALVLNEILLNAAKHRAGDTPVRLSFQVGPDRHGMASLLDRTPPVSDCEYVVLQVWNAGSLPEGFDLASGTGVGTGLELACLLLPRTGATLELRSGGGEVTARLALSRPLVSYFHEFPTAKGPTR